MYAFIYQMDLPKEKPVSHTIILQWLLRSNTAFIIHHLRILECSIEWNNQFFFSFVYEN